MQHQEITIINKLGLHARAAAKFVSCAARFVSDIQIKKGNQVINGKSIMGVMMLAASKGTKIELIIEGEDEKELMDAIVQLIQNRFDEAE